MKKCKFFLALAAFGIFSAAAPSFASDAHDHQSHAEEIDSQAVRDYAAEKTEWRRDDFHKTRSPVHVKILGFNDFHGHISPGTKVANRPAGGAAVFASYLRVAQAGMEDRTFIVHAGDAVGASPLSSALLFDEPTIDFFNQLTNKNCRYQNRSTSRCNMIGTLGNHEFDRGQDELLRLLNGGNQASGPLLNPHFRGAKFPYVSANVVSAKTGKPILSPYVIRKARYKDQEGESKEMPIAFIGAVLQNTPSIVTPAGIAGLKFLDEAEAINSYIPEIKAQGVNTIVVLIHQGGFQSNYIGQTDPLKAKVSGEIVGIVSRLASEIDVVVSGHSHAFTNSLLPNQQGKQILVSQAFSYSTAFAEIDLQIDPKTRDVVAKSASIVTTFADQGPGLAPDQAAAELTAEAEAKVAPIANQLIGSITADILRSANSAGESPLGNLIADAQRAALKTDIAFMNPGGVRADLLFLGTHNPPQPNGTVTYNDLFTIQPFGNSLVKMDLTGQQILDVLNQQFPPNQTSQRILLPSGLTYTWSASELATDKISNVLVNGVLLVKTTTYSVTVNSFLSSGGDNFTVFNAGTNRTGGAQDIDALVDYIKSLPQPLAPPAVGKRITKIN
jgi:5'-nucleotidase